MTKKHKLIYSIHGTVEQAELRGLEIVGGGYAEGVPTPADRQVQRHHIEPPLAPPGVRDKSKNKEE